MHKVVEGRVDNALAWAAFADEVTKDGWGKLYVHAAPSGGAADDDDDDGSFAMGYLEGLLTAERISQHFLSWCAKSRHFNVILHIYNKPRVRLSVSHVAVCQQGIYVEYSVEYSKCRALNGTRVSTVDDCRLLN